MSVINDLDVNGQFTGITSNKGDILVNNGTSNSAFPVFLDGYILSADSSEPFGLKWIPNTGGGEYLSTSQINILSPSIQTNSTFPITLSELTQTGYTGDVIFFYNINFKVSKSRKYINVGLYKNNILIQNRVYGGIDDNITSINLYYAFNLINTDIIEVKVSTFSTDYDLFIFERSLFLIQKISMIDIDQISITTPSFYTNNTSPTDISDLNITGKVGNIILFYNLNCKISKSRRSFIVGLYINDVLVPNSNKLYGGIDSTVYSISLQYKVALVATDLVKIKISVQNLDTTIEVIERAIISIAY